MIAVIGKRSPVQMQQVSQAFKAALGRDLVDDLRKETSGNFGRLAVDMAIPLAEFDASCVQQAVAGFGTNEGLLIEVLSGRSNMEINAIKAAYQKLYRRDLEREVANDLAGHLRRFFIGLVQGQRDETGQVLDISGDVQSLYQAGEGKWGTDGTLPNIRECVLYDLEHAIRKPY